MSTKTITRTACTIDDHPEPSKVYEWIRNNWHDLNEHDVTEMIESLKSIAERLNTTLDYSIGQVPDRGEHITFKQLEDREPIILDASLIDILKDESTSCIYTGHGHDYVLSLAIDDHQDPTLKDICDTISTRALQLVHDQTEYVYSDEGLKELCEANDYYFFDDGEFQS